MPGQISHFLRYSAPLLGYCTAIFIQSSFPASDSLPVFPLADKLYHAAAYALMGCLWYRLLRTLPVGRSSVRLVWLSILASSLYGVSDELHQAFVPSRSAELWDAAADTLGSGLGVLAIHHAARHSRIDKLGFLL